MTGGGWEDTSRMKSRGTCRCQGTRPIGEADARLAEW